MAYNQHYAPHGGEDYAEHLAHPYSDDPFAGSAGNHSAQPYAGLPLGPQGDPELVDLTRDRPVSAISSSEAGGASAYWQPGARTSAGAGMGGAYLGADDFEDDGQDSWWRRHRWAVIAGVLGLIAALAIGLGVGLGVGLNKSKHANNAAQLSDPRSSATSGRSNSVSVGTVVFTSTSVGSNGGAAATITSTSETSAVVAVPTTSSTSAAPASSSAPASPSTTTPPPSSTTTTPPPTSASTTTSASSSSSSSSSLTSSSSSSSSSSASSTTTQPPSSSSTSGPASSTTTPPPSSSSATTTAAPAAGAGASPARSTDSNGGSYVFTTRPIVNPGGFTIGTLTGYVTSTAT